MQALDLLSQAATHHARAPPSNSAYLDYPAAALAPSIGPITNGTVRARESDDEEGGDKKKKKRNRLALNCNECRRRKVKCDRNKPCEGCIRRGEPDKCAWDSEVPPQPFALNTNVRQLEARYKVLEDFVLTRYRDSHPDLAAALEAAAATAAQPPPTDAAPSPSTSTIGRIHHNPKTLNKVELEAEDAANVIEDLAMSSLTYVASSIDGPRQASRRAPLQTGETSIFLESPLDTTRSLFPVDEVYRRVMDVLPPMNICDYLLRVALNDAWFLGSICPHLFLKEADEFWWAIEKSLLNDVDPCFVSSLLAALVAGFEMLDESVTHICGRPIEECEALVPRWTAACNQALALGNWTAVPQYRVIQTVLFKWSPCVPEVVNSPLWSTMIVRIAQVLGFHRLGQDQHTMPTDSPGLPAGACSLKRQIACRVWHQLLFIDCMSSFKTCIFQVRSQKDYTTALPLSVNDSELGTHVVVEANSRDSSMTDGSYSRLKSIFATAMREFAISALALMQDAPEKPYDRIREIDAKFRKELEPIIATTTVSDPVMLAAMKAGFYFRLTRLHRAFAPLGLKDSRYAFSTRTSVECGRACIAAAAGIASRKLWFMILHAIGAAIVLFQHMWLTEGTSSRLLDIEDFRRDIAMCKRFFEYQQTSRSKLCQWSAAQALRSTHALEEEFAKRQKGSIVGSPHESFAIVLRKVADESASPPPHSGPSPAQPTLVAATPPPKPMDLSFLTSPMVPPPRPLPVESRPSLAPPSSGTTSAFWDDLLGPLGSTASDKSTDFGGLGAGTAFDWQALFGASAL